MEVHVTLLYPFELVYFVISLRKIGTRDVDYWRLEPKCGKADAPLVFLESDFFSDHILYKSYRDFTLDWLEVWQFLMFLMISPVLLFWFWSWPSCSISKSNMYSQLQQRLDVVLFEIIFPLMCFNDNDQRLWDEDPHEYVRKGYGVLRISSFFLFFWFILFGSLNSWMKLHI